MISRIIDTHLHVWDLDRANYPWLEQDNSILNRSWSIDELESSRKDAGVSSAVLVQAAGNKEDTEWMLQVGKQTEWVSGIVGWLPLMDTVATSRLWNDRYSKEELFKGVRHQIHDEQDARWLLQPAVIDSLKLLEGFQLPFDVVAVLPAHIETALAVAEKIPGLRMVFDHLSQPPIATQERFGRWGELMKEAAKSKQFYAKISGLGTASGNFANRTTDEIRPYIEFALEHFGVDRCFCGGDWPVSMLANTYETTWQQYKDILEGILRAEDLDKVFYSNAKEFYQLQIS